jgi:hypothetical protein
MKQTAFQNGQRQVGKCTCILIKIDLINDNLAISVQAHLKICTIGMTLAGQTHIFFAAQLYFYRPLQLPSCQGYHDRPRSRLFFLATKATTDAGNIDFKQVHWAIQHPGGYPLHHSW